MALPASGPLALTDIQTEFGGSNPIGLSEYYAGGSYVSSSTTGTNGAVPSSGAISIWNFYGTTAFIPVGLVVLKSDTAGTYPYIQSMNPTTLGSAFTTQYTFSITTLPTVVGGNTTKTLMSINDSSISNSMVQTSYASLGTVTAWGSYPSGQYTGSRACTATYAFVAAGWNYSPYTPVVTNAITAFSLATDGNTTAWGTTSGTRYSFSAGNSNNTVTAIVYGGSSATGAGNQQSNMQSYTLSTAGNASIFGNLPNPRVTVSSVSSATRSVAVGGYYDGTSLGYLEMEYVTFASLGNSADFGSLSAMRLPGGVVSSKTYGIFAGGRTGANGTYVSDIEYISIASLGNVSAWGQTLSQTVYDGSGGSSNCHGGL